MVITLSKIFKYREQDLKSLNQKYKSFLS